LNLRPPRPERGVLSDCAQRALNIVVQIRGEGREARAPTRSVAVSHPRLAGLTERVERVVDTLDAKNKETLTIGFPC
jgi:hypothetical protein